MIVEVLTVFGTWAFTFGMFFAFAGNSPWFMRCMGIAAVCGVEIEIRTRWS